MKVIHLFGGIKNIMRMYELNAMGENLLKTGAATFYVVDPALEHEDDNPFIMWLVSE